MNPFPEAALNAEQQRRLINAKLINYGIAASYVIGMTLIVVSSYRAHPAEAGSDSSSGTEAGFTSGASQFLSLIGNLLAENKGKIIALSAATVFGAFMTNTRVVPPARNQPANLNMLPHIV